MCTASVTKHTVRHFCKTGGTLPNNWWLNSGLSGAKAGSLDTVLVGQSWLHLCSPQFVAIWAGHAGSWVKVGVLARTQTFCCCTECFPLKIGLECGRNRLAAAAWSHVHKGMILTARLLPQESELPESASWVEPVCALLSSDCVSSAVTHAALLDDVFPSARPYVWPCWTS